MTSTTTDIHTQVCMGDYIDHGRSPSKIIAFFVRNDGSSVQLANGTILPIGQITDNMINPKLEIIR